MVKILPMSEMLVIMCTCPDEATASKLAGGLVEEQLAACVNIVPGIRSIYHWQGKISNDAEVLMVIKSLASRFEELESWLLEHHPYDIPEIVALPVSRVSAEYRAWIESSIGLPLT
ncbi:MAG: divalent-cation tolerance protein CutA [Xanthomonadales bacterium]